MKVKDIIKCALILIGREDIVKNFTAEQNKDSEAAEAFEDAVLPEEGETTEEAVIWTPEQKETVETLLYCFNAVADELARYYFPLTKKENFFSSDGFYAFSNFSERPIKILSVKSGGRDVKYEVDTLGLKACHGAVTIEFCYAPKKKNLDGLSEYGEEMVSERLIAAGLASEYFLICGEVSAAQSWESVYRGEIDRLQRKNISGLQIPPRRWV